MSIPFPASINKDSLFIWLIHSISETFHDRAILKGGMALRLIESPRNTNDLDYIFVPYESKKDILVDLENIVSDIPDSEIDISLHSKSVRINIYHKKTSIQLEANVGKECKSLPISTSSYAKRVNETGRIINIMDLNVALSHKLCAWNERRLVRDLYDIYFLYKMVNAFPEKNIIIQRLNNIQSRIPRLKKKKKMGLYDFFNELLKEIKQINFEKIKTELSPLLKKEDLVGLDIKIKAALNELLDKMETSF